MKRRLFMEVPSPGVFSAVGVLSPRRAVNELPKLSSSGSPSGAMDGRREIQALILLCASKKPLPRRRLGEGGRSVLRGKSQRGQPVGCWRPPVSPRTPATAATTAFPQSTPTTQGAHQTWHDWHGCLEFKPDGCFVAEADGLSAGTATAISVSGYPDRGASAEVYSNGDPKAYVELEVLGPLSRLRPGESIQRVSSYALFRRTTGKADDEAGRILKR